jgi:hypothetical protein
MGKQNKFIISLAMSIPPVVEFLEAYCANSDSLERHRNSRAATGFDSSYSPKT